MKYDMIVFDLDGTLIDTSKGIFNSVRYAEGKMGFRPIQERFLKEFVGPPPKEMYQKIYGVDEKTAMQATKYHREYGRTKAIYEIEIYDEMEKVLKELRQRGYYLSVATLKQQLIAEKVLEFSNLRQYFDVVVGMDLQETYTKCMTIQKAIEYYATVERSLMIGDTIFDFKGAQEAGVDFIGVTYGFGFKQSQKNMLDLPRDILLICE